MWEIRKFSYYKNISPPEAKIFENLVRLWWIMLFGDSIPWPLLQNFSAASRPRYFPYYRNFYIGGLLIQNFPVPTRGPPPELEEKYVRACAINSCVSVRCLLSGGNARTQKKFSQKTSKKSLSQNVEKTLSKKHDRNASFPTATD